MEEDVLRLRCEPLGLVRVGIIGLGQRGMKTLLRYAGLRGAAVTCLADIDGGRARLAADRCLGMFKYEPVSIGGQDAWKELCGRADVDLVFICTGWDTHTPMAVYAMECGKHVAVEVPAATTVDECWALVDTAERTRRHCFMAENCCYDRFALATLEMARRGVFGTLTHCEGGYIHNLRREMGVDGQGADCKPWLGHAVAEHGGNPYPTHGLGPVGWLLGLHRGDRMETLVSVTSRGADASGVLSQVNNTVVKTLLGVSILLQFDITTPRPYSRLQTICGGKGFARKYPMETVQTDGGELLSGEAAEEFMDGYFSSPAAECWREGREMGVENEMNYAMDRRLVDCLLAGKPLDIDVYDAAEWSSIVELSRRSALQGGMPVGVPDFTRGRWQRLCGFEFG